MAKSKVLAFLQRKINGSTKGTLARINETGTGSCDGRTVQFLKEFSKMIICMGLGSTYTGMELFILGIG